MKVEWLVCFILSMLILAASVGFVLAIRFGKYKRGRLLRPINVAFFGVFLASFVMLLPIYTDFAEKGIINGFQSVLFALHNTFQVFTIDADRAVIMENVDCGNRILQNLYGGTISLLFVIAPILTFGFVISFFKTIRAYFRYIMGFFREVYVFSELNEKSLALAADIKNNHRNAVLVFTDVFESNDEISFELIERANELNAICFKKDVLAINFKLHNNGSPITFFVIGEDEGENIEQSLKLISSYKKNDNISLYVFSTGVESEILLTKADKGNIKVRRVNEIRSLINRLLYERGVELFENAKPMEDGIKQISAVIIGLGQHGTEMLKSLAWYCQMTGYRVKIDAFEMSPEAEDRFTALAPELMSPRYNGVLVQGEPEYTITIHSGFDVTTQSFADELSKLTDTTYVFVSLGSDSMNIRTAVTLRMLFERMHIKPIIQPIIYSTPQKDALSGVTNYRGQPYDIEFIGDLKSSFSEKVIMNSELEADALSRHMKWGKEEEFWQYEYNYNSSMASAIHMIARIACGIIGADKKEEDLTEEERNAIEVLEHCRWNAYMRSEGYIYSGSHDKKSRNDLGKMHHDLIVFDLLDEEEKRKDSSVGTK